MKSFIAVIISLLCAVGLLAQSKPSQPAGADHQGQSATSTGQNQKPIDSSNFDTALKPGDDFFLYANGGWIKRTEIPPEYTRWGSFNELIEHNNDALHEIAEKAENTKVDPRMAPEPQKVGDFYASGMDEKTIEASGAKPLDDEFKKIDAISDRDALQKEIAHLHSMGIPVLFNFGSSPDSKDSTHEIAQAVQGGLGLPDRDYYTKTDDASKKLRNQYVDHVAKMLTLLGEPAPKAQEEAKKMLEMETKLAKSARTRVELRDPQKNYNKMPVRQLQNLTPDWNWGDYFNQINLLSPQNVNVHQPEFFKTADQVFKETPLDDLKAYLRWHLIDATASDLSKNFVEKISISRSEPCVGRSRSNRAGNAWSSPKTTRSARHSASFTSPIIFRPKQRHARSRWSTT